MRELARHERVRNDADYVTARREHGIGDNAHQPDVAPAEHETNATPRHLVRELFRSARILRPGADARAAEDTDARRDAHGSKNSASTLPDYALLSSRSRQRRARGVT